MANGVAAANKPIRSLAARTYQQMGWIMGGIDPADRGSIILSATPDNSYTLKMIR
jgi:hypothetical protein